MDKLKVGDRVRIKTVEEMKKCAIKVIENDIFCDLEIRFNDDGCPRFVKNMIPLCGTYATVAGTGGPDFEHIVWLTDFSSDADTHWVYCDYMLEKVDDKEEIKAGHDAKMTVCDEPTANNELKVGDLVKFKTIEEMRKCSTSPNGTSSIIRFPETGNEISFIIDDYGMQHLCGTYARVKDIHGHNLTLTDFTSDGDTTWSYCDSMVTKVDKKELKLNDIVENCEKHIKNVNDEMIKLKNELATLKTMIKEKQ